MRFPPAHAAPREFVPPKRRVPKPLRTALSVAVAGVFGLVPAVMVASPAQAAPSDFLTISNVGNWEGSNVTFKLTYTGTMDGSFDLALVAPGTGNTAGAADFSPTDSLVSSYFSTGVVDNIAVGLGGKETIEFKASSPTSPSTATVTAVTVVNSDLDGAAAATNVDELFAITATPKTPTIGDTKTATGEIWSSGAYTTYPTVTFSAPTTISEAVTSAGAQQSVTVTANLSRAADHDIAIPVQTVTSTDHAPLTAISTGGVNRDYDAFPATATIVFPSGQLTGSVNVNIWDDSVDEQPTQYVKVEKFGSFLGVESTSASVEIGILDNDATPTVSIGDATAVVEGSPAFFPITLSSLSELPLHVDVSTSDGTDTATSRSATGGPTTTGDYTTATTAPVEIPKLNRVYNYSVATTSSVTEGAKVEGTETFTASLSPNAAADLAVGTPLSATGTITDGTALPSVTMLGANDPSTVAAETGYAEGSTGSVDTFVWLTVPAAGSATRQAPLVIDYSFTDGTAKNGVDYRGTSGTLTVPVATATVAAQPLKIPVTIIGDTLKEGTGTGEAFNVVLASANGTIASASLVPYPVTILDGDDDVVPSWTTRDVNVAEGNAGSAMARVPITLNGTASTAVTFTASFTGTNSATETGVSAGLTVGDNDYDLPTTRTVTIAAGSTAGYLDIPINGDAVYERDEAFTVTLTPTPVGSVDSGDTADVLHVARVAITNDDTAPKVTFNSTAATEGSQIRITGTTAGLSQYPYTLGFAVAPSGTNPATVGTDYEVETSPLPAYTVARGSEGPLLRGTPASSTITNVFLLADTLVESVETFGVTATETTASPTGIVTATGTYRINDADGGPTDPEEPTGPKPTLTAEPFRLGVGDLDLTGKAAPSVQVELWAATMGGGDLAKVDETESDTDGDYKFTATFEETGWYFQTKASGVLSDIQQVWLKHDPHMTSTSMSKRAVTLRTFGDPRLAGLTVVVQRYVDGMWVKVGVGMMSEKGMYTRTFTNLPSRQGVTHRAYVVGDVNRGLLGGYSHYSRTIVR